MHNDSIETLLLRHYGRSATTPATLERRLLASLNRNAQETQRQRRDVSRWRTARVSRRRAMRFVALGSAGVGLLGVGLEGLRSVENALLGHDAAQPAFP